MNRDVRGARRASHTSPETSDLQQNCPHFVDQKKNSEGLLRREAEDGDVVDSAASRREKERPAPAIIYPAGERLLRFRDGPRYLNCADSTTFFSGTYPRQIPDDHQQWRPD